MEKAIKKTLAIIEITRENEQLEIESDVYTKRIFWMLESKGFTPQSRDSRDPLLDTSDNTIFMKYTDSENDPIFIVIARNNEMTMDIIGGMKAISSRIEKIKYRNEIEISNRLFRSSSMMVRIHDSSSGIIDNRQLSELNYQMEKMKRASFLVLAAEGFSEIDKIKAAHKSIKFESTPKLDIWDSEKINQLILDEGLEI